ncbi:aquaporin-like protein [Linnemannia elongata]|nr:aquaporin-like protein [Linnemannia elongata]
MSNRKVISELQRWYIPATGEFIGTAMFLYLAVGGADAVSRDAAEGTGVLGVAFAFGMGLMVTAWAFGRISGAHFNPAITLACLIAGDHSFGKAIMYLICQLLGASLGVAMARGTTPNNVYAGGINTLVRGFFLEFWLTSILCFVYLTTTDERARSSFMAPLPIGFTLFSCHLFAVRYTNASINPARAFATSLVSRHFTSDHWIYWLGPFGGGILAAGLYMFFCHFDIDTVRAEAQRQTEVAACPSETVNIDGMDNNKSAPSTFTATGNQVAPTGDAPTGTVPRRT